MNTVQSPLGMASIIGLGNVFLGDDGFGPLAVEVFRCRYDVGPEVEAHDLGTPGLDLAPYLYDRKLILIVDAVHADFPPGTLSLFREEDFVSSRAKLRITGHDPGLWESLSHLRLAGRAPLQLAILGITPESCGFGDAINTSIFASAARAAEIIAEVLEQNGFPCRLRAMPEEPNLWWMPKHLAGNTAAA